MQASQEFFGLIVFTLHPFGCVPQLKHTFLDSSRPLCSSLLPYIVTFQILCSVFKVQSPTAFAVRFEDPTQSGWVFKSNSKSCLVGPSGLEPPTLRLSVVRSSQLSYGPVSGLLSSLLVEIVGIEPATSCLQGRRSPS